MTTSAALIKSFVERVERIEQDIKDLNDDKRDIYADAKSQGFDLPALKAVIARRRKDPDKLTEFEALVETYEAALGTPVATRVHAQETAAVHSVTVSSKGDCRLSSDAAELVTVTPTEDPLAIPAFLKRERASA